MIHPKTQNILSHETKKSVETILLKTWRKLDTPLSGFIPGGDAGLLIITTVASILAYTGVMMVIINEVAGGFVKIVTDVPSFGFQVIDGVETGNASYILYSLLSQTAFYFFILVFLVFGALLVLKQAELVSSDTLKNMVKSAFVGIIIIIVFPYAWDPISDLSEMSALWMLNPLYSFDDENPCIAFEDDTRLVILADHQETMKRKSEVGGFLGNPNDICSPSLRPDYLFSKAIFGASLDIEFETDDDEWWNILDRITTWVTVGAQGLFSIIFEGVTKTTMLFFLASMSALVGSMRYLLTDVVAIGLPVFLVLRCLPIFGIAKLADTLLTLFVPLLFVPFFTALIITAGSASLLQDEVDTGTITNRDDLDSLASDRYLFWVYAIATLALGVMTPVMFVPMLGSVASMMGRMVMTSTMTGVMGAAQAGAGVARGATSAMSGIKAGGKMSNMGLMKSMLTNPRTMGSIIGGMGSGGMGAMKGAFKNDLAGANTMMPGAGKAGTNIIDNPNPQSNSDNPVFLQGQSTGQGIAEGQEGESDDGKDVAKTAAKTKKPESSSKAAV